MVRNGSVIYCKDNTGVKLVRVIQVVGGRRKRKAKLGDRVLVAVHARNLKAKNLKNERQLIRFRRGSVHRAIVINVKKWYFRPIGIHVRWDHNAVILVDKYDTPLGSKIQAAVIKEFMWRYPALGSIIHEII